MATNFTFLKEEWRKVYDSAIKAEKNISSEPRTACFYARHTLEISVDWMYQFDEYLSIPMDTSLYGVMKADFLYQPPYTNFNTDGLSGVFSIDDSHQIVTILDTIRKNAAA
ncbi:MAG: hypothetical protein ACR2F2_03295 [Pyrinomonadaceae bacterium]